MSRKGALVISSESPYKSITKDLKYKIYTLRNFRSIPQMEKVSEDIKFAIEVVGTVLPFKTNNYVVDELIDWNNIPNDEIFTLNFPRKELLPDTDFSKIAHLIKTKAPKEKLDAAVHKVRMALNPNPAGQQHNVPEIDGQKLEGMQHKYEETVLFFPTQGQTCHAYCTFCFRWPQFVGMEGQKFAMREADLLARYVAAHPEVTNVLFTGGDPMVMNSKTFAVYIDALLDMNIPHLRSIRIGSKSLSYWPYKYVSDDDAAGMLDLFRKITDSGIHLAFMAHFNHPRELNTDAVRHAIREIRTTGAEIRTQSPILKHINDCPELWEEMWKTQVQLGLIPYYMFVVRDTGAQGFYGMSLVEAQKIFREAYRKTSGLARTVRGPSMSAHPGKIQVLGIHEVNGEKVIALTMIQGRKSDWVAVPFFAKYNEAAIWIDDLEPAFEHKEFFYEAELREMYAGRKAAD
jgi:KamA family protein